MNVPQIGLGNVQTEVVAQPTFTGDAFGAGTWRAVGQAADAGLKAGQVTANIMEKQDAATADSAIANAQLKLNKLANDIQTQYQGENIGQRAAKFQEGVTAIHNEITKGLPAGALKHFTPAWSRATATQGSSLDDRTRADTEAFEVASFNNKVKTNVELFAQENSPAAAEQRLKEAEEAMLSFGEKKGLTPELAATAIKKVRSDAYTARAMQLALSPKTGAIEAQKYIESKKDQMTAEAYQEFTKNNAVTYQKEVNETQAWEWNKSVTGTYDDKLAAAMILPSGVREAAIKIITDAKELESKTTAAALAGMIQTISDSKILPPADSALSGTPAYAALEVIATKGDDKKELAYGNFYKVAAMIDSGEWKNIPAIIVKDKKFLSAAGAQKLMSLYSARLGGSDTTKDTELISEDATIRGMFEASTGKKAVPSEPEFVIFNKAYRDSVSAEEASKKRSLSRDDRELIARVKLMKQKTGSFSEQPVYRGVVKDLRSETGEIIQKDIASYARAIGIVKTDSSTMSTEDLVKLYHTFDQKLTTDELASLGNDNLLELISNQLKNGSTFNR